MNAFSGTARTVSTFLFSIFMVTVILLAGESANSMTCEEQFKKVPATAGEVFRATQYRPGQCHRNIVEFMKNMEAEGLPVDQMQIIAIHHVMLAPIRDPRTNRAWNYHVVLRWGDKIYDFDASREPISLSDFKNRWHPFFEQPFMKAVVIPAVAYRATAVGMGAQPNEPALIDAIIRTMPMMPAATFLFLH